MFRISHHLDSDKQHLNGKEVTIARVLCPATITDEEAKDFDNEALPMLYVNLVETGERLTVWPEELEGEREWGIADAADPPHVWASINGLQVLALPNNRENLDAVMAFAGQNPEMPIGYTTDRDGSIVKGSVYD